MNTEPIVLKEITDENLRGILRLSVASEQSEYVATNAQSIAEAYFHLEAWFRGIYAGDTPVGFVMLEDWSLIPEKFNDQPLLLWRFMLDKQFQGKGYGKQALRLIAEYARTRTKLEHFLTSCVEGPHSPKQFYLKFGFIDTGEVFEGETVLRYQFDQSERETF